MKILPILFILLIQLTLTHAQNLETIKDTPKNVKFGGGLRLSTQFYNVSGIDARRSPFSWVISGNARLTAGQFKIPIRFTFRDQKFNTSGPSYNKFGISPYYKWVRLHLGHRSMRFSKYSLSGKTFFGVGIELKPKYFRLSAFKGSFRNPLALQDTLVYGGILIPTYKRKAIGVKVGFGGTKNHWDVSYLKIKDDLDTAPTNPSKTLNPQENIVLGTNWRLTIFKGLFIGGSLNASGYSENMNLSPIPIEDSRVQFLTKFIEPNSSTKLSLAGDLSLNLQIKQLLLGLTYRRVEPNYRSLGISFIQADVESIMTSTSFSLFKRKLSLNAQVGIERNNLRNLDLLTRKRIINSYRANWSITKGLNMMAHYANYQYESTDGLINVNDTLRYVNVSKLAGLNINYTKKNEQYNYGVFTNLQRQLVEDQSPIANLGTDILNYQWSIGGLLKIKDIDFAIKPSLNYSRFDIATRLQERYGLGLNLSKTLLDKKVTLKLLSRYSLNSIDKFSNGYVLTNRLSSKYNVSKKQAINFQIAYMIKTSSTSNNFSELRGGLNYSIRF